MWNSALSEAYAFRISTLPIFLCLVFVSLFSPLPSLHLEHNIPSIVHLTTPPLCSTILCRKNIYIVQETHVSHLLIHNARKIGNAFHHYIHVHIFSHLHIPQTAHTTSTSYISPFQSQDQTTMSFDKMAFLTTTSHQGLSLSLTNNIKAKKQKGRSFFSRIKPTSKSNITDEHENERPLSFLAIPYTTTVDNAGRPFMDIPEPVYEIETSSSGSASTQSCNSEYQAVSVARYKPTTQLTSILITPTQGNYKRSGSRNRKHVRFASEPAQLISHSTRRRRPTISPPSPLAEDDNNNTKPYLPISPLYPTTSTTQRIPLKRSNASYDSTTSTSSSSSRHDAYTAAAESATVALRDKIRAARAGEVFAKRAMLARACDDGEGEGEGEGEYAISPEGWGRRA